MSNARRNPFPPAPRNFLIWSNEHQAWWRANKNGYTKDATEAGIYSKADAQLICANALLGPDKLCGIAPETAVPDFTQQRR